MIYEKKLEHKKKSRDFPEDNIDDWKKNPGERACRIWTFWKDKSLLILNSYFIGMIFDLMSSHNYEGCYIE